jgi:hypothetical protein
VFFLYICPAVDSNGGAIRGVCDEAASRVQRSYERSARSEHLELRRTH